LAIDHDRENNVHPLPSATPARDEPAGKKRQTTGLSKKRIAALALVPLIAIAAAGAWFKFHPRADPASRFMTAAVAQGDIEDTVTALGNLQPMTYVDVGAQVSGQLTKINVVVGQKVKQGDLLAEIDPTLAEAKVNADNAALANLEAQLIDRRAQLDLSQEQLTRQQNLMKDNATSEDALQVAATAVKSNKALISALEAQAKEAQSTLSADRTSLGYTKIYAPMTGTVVLLATQQGQTLNATQSTPVILRIADLATMTVWTQVSEADVPRLKVGMAAYFTTLGDQSHKWRGKLLQILPSPEVVNNVVLYPALFQVANPDGKLMSQMSAQVFFVVAAVRNAVTVPVAALNAGKNAAVPAPSGDDATDATPYQVRVLNANGHAKRRQVWIGVSNRVSAEVLDGLAPGDLVVVGRRDNGDTDGASGGGRTGIRKLF
jgi:macrolide-specific efflux system membrane fusion protein